MTLSRRVALQTLAEQAASKIGFTLRRWWQDATNPSVLRVEVERRLIGAPPAIGELTVPVPDQPSQRRKHLPPVSVSARPRKVRRRQSVNTSSPRQRSVRPQKRKASTTAMKEHPSAQRKTTKAQAQERQRPSARTVASTRPTGSRERRK